MHPAAKQTEDQEERRERALQARVLTVGIAQPLPLEVEPPHADLRAERCLTVGDRRLGVLAAIEVVLEGIVGPLGKSAGEFEAIAAGGRLAFVDRREVGGANGLRGERTPTEDERADGGENEPPAQQCGGLANEHRDADRGDGEHARHVIRVAKAGDEGEQDEDPVGLASLGLVTPADGEPGGDREARERDGVDLLVHDRLRPDGEGRRTDECGERAADDALPALLEPADEHALGDEEPHPCAHGARDRREEIDPHRDGRCDREDREDAPDEDEERIARGMRQAERIRRRDVLARVPHRRLGRERDEEEEEGHPRRDGGGEIGRAVVEVGGHL